MATLSSGRAVVGSRSDVLLRSPRYASYRCIFCQEKVPITRQFSSSTIRRSAYRYERGSFRARLRVALRDTKVKWYPIPIGLGIGFLGFTQLYRQQQQRERLAHDESVRSDQEPEGDHQDKEGRPRKRKRIRPSGPWCVLLSSSSCPHSCLLSSRSQASSSHVHVAFEGNIPLMGPLQ